MNKLLWTTGAVVVFVAGTSLWLMKTPTVRETPRNRPQMAQRSPEPVAPPRASDDREVAELRHEVRSLRGHIDEAVKAPESTDPIASASDHPPQPEPEVYHQQQRAEQAQHYDDVFDEQGVDTRWAEREERTLITAFESEEFTGLGLRSIQCRSTMCRLEIDLDKPADSDVLIAQIGRPPLDQGGRFRPGDDDTTMIVYTGRRGHSIEGS